MLRLTRPICWWVSMVNFLIFSIGSSSKRIFLAISREPGKPPLFTPSALPFSLPSPAPLSILLFYPFSLPDFSPSFLPSCFHASLRSSCHLLIEEAGYELGAYAEFFDKAIVSETVVATFVDDQMLDKLAVVQPADLQQPIGTINIFLTWFELPQGGYAPVSRKLLFLKWKAKDLSGFTTDRSKTPQTYKLYVDNPQSIVERNRP